VNPRTIIASAALLALAACGSPLDVSTPRIDTRLTNRIKLRDVSVSARVERPGDTTHIDDWRHGTVSATFIADTAGDPPRVSMDCRWTALPGDTATTVLKEIRIRLDDVEARGSLPLTGLPAGGTGALATVVVDGVEYTSGTAYTASAVLYYLPGDTRKIQGTIVIGMDRSPAFTARVAINFLASQD
jgi:hypothetical protein